MNYKNNEPDEVVIKPPKIDFFMLKPTSRGLGFRIAPSGQEKRAREQEEKAYAPFCKRKKNEEENLKYVHEHCETNKKEFALSSHFANKTDDVSSKYLFFLDKISYNEYFKINLNYYSNFLLF